MFRFLLTTACIFLLSSTAQADGSLTLRGVYYKERSTRVMQPMMDANLDVGDDGELNAHTAIDAITSASAASGASGQAFTETRIQMGGLYMHRFGDLRIGGGGRYSSEPDYRSTFVNLRLESSFAQQNSILGITLTRGHDSLDNSGSQGGLSARLTGELDTTLVTTSFSQILSPVSVLGFSYDLSYLDGFQENIYRRVIAGGMALQERVPETRLRHALATNLRYHLLATQSTLIAAYRLYVDDWGILGHTPEARVVQEILDEELEASLAYRYYTQSAADFYQSSYDSADPIEAPYLTDDDKLSEMHSHSISLKLGAKLSLLGMSGRWEEGRIEFLGQYLTQTTRFGNAIVTQMALTIPVEY